MTNNTTSNTAQLAAFASALRFDDIPEPVVRKIEDLLVDWFGSAVAGHGSRPVESITRFAQAMGQAQGPSEVIINGARTTPYLAAMANAAASHVAEQDDVHNGSVFHPATVVFSPAVAVAQALGASGKQLLAASVVGYEVGIRVGEFLGRSHYRVFHTTGTAGTLAAGAAVGHLLGLNAQQMQHALGSAGTQSAGLWEFLRTAADSKQLATPLLPAAVTQQGLVVSKSTKNFLMVLGFVSENGSMKQADLGDYVAANVIDPLSRVEGVGDVTLFGSQYAMRIWLDPTKLQSFQLTPADVTAAITAQNTEVSAGELGGAPAMPGQQLNATVSAQSRLQTAEQFGAILLKTTASGATVHLRDVARMELGSESYNTVARFNGNAATGVAIKLATGANALDTAKAVNAKIEQLSKQFPAGMKAEVAFDTTPFVKLSIEEVVKTLVEAVILVFLVMYLFLQNFRATLIPTMAVPVV
eukprot:gene14955-17150_t